MGGGEGLEQVRDELEETLGVSNSEACRVRKRSVILVSVLSVALFCARISARDWAEAYAASARGSRYVRYILTNNNTRLRKRVQEPERLNEMSRNISAQYGVRLSKHSEREDCLMPCHDGQRVGKRWK